jgi:hypothetical protein
MPILKTMFAEAMPALMASLQANAAWLEANPDATELPRAVGEHEFVIGGKHGKRSIRAYSQWMLQRPLAHYASLAGAERERADELLKAVGGYDCMQTEISRPVERRNNLLVATTS